MTRTLVMWEMSLWSDCRETQRNSPRKGVSTTSHSTVLAHGIAVGYLRILLGSIFLVPYSIEETAFNLGIIERQQKDSYDFAMAVSDPWTMWQTARSWSSLKQVWVVIFWVENRVESSVSKCHLDKRQNAEDLLRTSQRSHITSNGRRGSISAVQHPNRSST